MSTHHAGVLLGPDDPEAPVPVAAGELFEWAWLADELADWLTHAADTTAFDLWRYFGGNRSRDEVIDTLEHIWRRIGMLLYPDRGRP